MSKKKGLRLKKIIEKREMLTAKQFAVKRLSGLLIRFIIESFAVGGALASSALALEVEFDVPLFCILCAAICFGMEVLSHLQKKWKFIYPAAAAVFLGGAFLLRSVLYGAFCSIYNTAAAHFCTYYGKAHISIGSGVEADALGRTLVLSVLAVLLDMVVLYVVKENGLRILYLLVTLPVVLFPYLVGLPVQGTGIVFYTGATVSLICGHVTRHVNGKRIRTKNFTEYSIQGMILLVFLLIGLILPLVFTPEDYEEHFDAKGIKKAIQETMKGFENNAFDFFGGKDSSASYAGGLNKGKLGWVDQVNYTEDEALSVVLPGQMQSLSNKTLYLRGYIGDVYTANQMENLERESRQAYDDLERELDTDLSDITQKFLNSGILDAEVSKAFEMAAPKDAAGENLSRLLLKNKEGQLTLEESRKDITVKNVWTNKDEYFLPYFTENSMQRGHDGSISPGEETEIVENDEGTAYCMPSYYPVYSGIYRNLFGSDGEDTQLFGIEAIQEAYILEKGIEKYTGKSLEEYLEEPEDETVSVTSLLLGAGVKLSVAQLKDESQISLRKLADAVKNVKDFGILENKYREWVYSTYLTLPNGSCETMFEAMKENAVNRNFKAKDGWEYRSLEEIGGMSKEDIFKAVATVRKYISRDTEYSLTPGALPEGKDFVKYFLEEKKQGYCIHYAAAGMLALRAMGVPARYVEGFVVADENYENAAENPDGTITVSLKDLNAHAWVEIYVDGFGWFPVEMTPGYYVETGADQKAEDKNLEKDNEPEDSEAEDETEDGEDEADLEDFEEVPEESAPPTIPPEMKEWAEQEYGDQLAEEDLNVMLDENQEETADYTWLILLISILCGILVLVLAVLLQQKYVHGKREKAFRNPSPNPRIIHAYLLLGRMLCHGMKKIKKSHKNPDARSTEQTGSDENSALEETPSEKHVSEMELLEIARSASFTGMEKELAEIEGLAIQAYFSGAEMAEEEWEKAFAAYEKVRKKLYEEAAFWRKLYFRWKGF